MVTTIRRIFFLFLLGFGVLGYSVNCFGYREFDPGVIDTLSGKIEQVLERQKYLESRPIVVQTGNSGSVFGAVGTLARLGVYGAVIVFMAVLVDRFVLGGPILRFCKQQFEGVRKRFQNVELNLRNIFAYFGIIKEDVQNLSAQVQANHAEEKNDFNTVNNNIKTVNNNLKVVKKQLDKVAENQGVESMNGFEDSLTNIQEGKKTTVVSNTEKIPTFQPYSEEKSEEQEPDWVFNFFGSKKNIQPTPNTQTIQNTQKTSQTT